MGRGGRPGEGEWYDAAVHRLPDRPRRGGAALVAARGRVRHDSSALCVGDRVEARYRGGSYYSGNISRYCGEGKYDIAYDSDDGPWERGDGEGVEARLIRS